MGIIRLLSDHKVPQHFTENNIEPSYEGISRSYHILEATSHYYILIAVPRIRTTDLIVNYIAYKYLPYFPLDHTTIFKCRTQLIICATLAASR